MAYERFTFLADEMKPYLKVSAEAIAFQGNAFYDALTQAISDLRVAIRASTKDAFALPEGKAVEAVIRKFTNLSVTFYPDKASALEIGIFAPPVSNGHIFDKARGEGELFAKFRDSNLKELLKKHKSGFVKASVDIRENRVDGFFSEIPFRLAIVRHVFQLELFTDREIAAIVLHEIGHAFTLCEYLNRTVMTNQVLADIASNLKAKNPEAVTFVIVNAAKEMHLTARQKDALLTSKNPEDYVVCAYAIADEQSRSELGFSVYETTSMEQLADQYSARCGAGRELVLALSKLHRLYGYESARFSTARMGFQLFGQLVLCASLGIFASAGAFVAILLSISAAALLSALHVWTAKDEQLQTYDNEVTRFERIRHQFVQQLKNPDIPDVLRDELLANLAEIQSEVQEAVKRNVIDYTHDLSHYVALLFSGVYRKRFNMEQLQKQLESLASNNLFVQAAKLKALS